jgi:5-methylcytosine-specific restriction enzyme subunit McrC
MAQWRGKWFGAAESSPDLLGLLSRILVETTRGLLKKQLGRTHSQRRGLLNGIRGRVEFGESIKHCAFDRAAAYCSYPELVIDTLKNRIIRSTLNRLATDPRLHDVDSIQESKLRHEIRAAVRMMHGVELIRITVSDFSRLQIGRNDRDYALPLAICALVHRLEMPTEHSGDRALTSLLRDEITFHALFESFVRNFYRVHLTQYDVKREMLQWNDELGCELVPAMRTDISIIGKAAPRKRLIIDTKYSIATLVAAPYGKARFKSENLYQLYAYLRTQEDLSDAHRRAEGMLLYPTTGCDVDASMLVQGHRIRVATVDLAATWNDIEARLLALIDPHPTVRQPLLNF